MTRHLGSPASAPPRSGVSSQRPVLLSITTNHHRKGKTVISAGKGLANAWQLTVNGERAVAVLVGVSEAHGEAVPGGAKLLTVDAGATVSETALKPLSQSIEGLPECGWEGKI